MTYMDDKFNAAKYISDLNEFHDRPRSSLLRISSLCKYRAVLTHITNTAVLRVSI